MLISVHSLSLETLHITPSFHITNNTTTLGQVKDGGILTLSQQEWNGTYPWALTCPGSLEYCPG